MFDMDISRVARQLLVEIGAPAGEVNIIPRARGGSQWELDVWVRSTGANLRIPPVFHGCRVRVVQKPPITSAASAAASVW